MTKEYLDKDFIIEDYFFKNYVNLTNEEKGIALKFRNKNRYWMINSDKILLENHLKWCENLKNKKEQIYFLIFKDSIPFMSVSYHDIDYEKKEAYWGYFLGEDSYKTEVLKIEKIIIDIAFERLDINKLLCVSDINNHVINIHKFFGFKMADIIEINERKFQKMYLIREQK